MDDQGGHIVRHVRYELVSESENLVEERLWELHWWTQTAVAALAQESCLEVAAVLNPNGGSAVPSGAAFAFWLTIPSD